MPHPDLYERLETLPSGVKGEIYNGQLHTKPSPPGAHVLAVSSLCAELSLAYRKQADTTAWWVLKEPEIHFKLDELVLVPDIAAWRKSSSPAIPHDHKFLTKPDWVCEVMSSETHHIEHQQKVELYAEQGIAYFWRVYPERNVVETYALSSGKWFPSGEFCGNDVLYADPFLTLGISTTTALGRDK